MRPAIIRSTLGAVVAATAAIALVSGTASRVCAQPCAPGGDSWRIYQEWLNASRSDTENGKTTARDRTTTNGSQESDNGQSVTDSSSRQSDGDGGAQESERICVNGTLVNPLSKNSCWNDDGSVSTLSRDWDRDAAGNTVQRMTDTTVTRNGDKTTTTRETTCDSQGKCSTTQKTTHDKVDPPDPHACDRPYWSGSITVDQRADSVVRPEQPFGFGIGRNQRATIVEESHMRDSVEVTLVAADALAVSRAPDAMIMRRYSSTQTKSVSTSQEIWCDQKWQGWSREYLKQTTAQGTGLDRGTAGVSLSSDGSFSISFYSVEATGTSTTNESDIIQPGKCWGTARNPQLSFSNPARWSGTGWSASGKVDPKNQTNLTGREGPMRWSLTRFDPKASRRGKQ